MGLRESSHFVLAILRSYLESPHMFSCNVLSALCQGSKHVQISRRKSGCVCKAIVLAQFPLPGLEAEINLVRGTGKPLFLSQSLMMIYSLRTFVNLTAHQSVWEHTRSKDSLSDIKHNSPWSIVQQPWWAAWWTATATKFIVGNFVLLCPKTF